jgi:hypothetical protein
MTDISSKPDQGNSPLKFARNVALKALGLFLLINLLFAVIYPLPALGCLTAYNHLLPGRKRLPYGDDPQRAYNLSLFNLEAMFASHELSGKAKPPDEFRVLVIGDSSTWGFLLSNDQTLAGQINHANARLTDGRTVRAYNLGYPVMSLTKDLLILSKALEYQPDLVIWPVTLESFPYDKQLFPPLLQNNPEPVKKLIEQYHLLLDTENAAWVEPDLLKRTLVGARRPLADLFRLQLFGILWSATGIDQDIPQTFVPRQEDLQADLEFHDLKPPHLAKEDLAFDVLAAGVRMAGNTPVLFINEPMFISHGKNSDLRYNFYYPRWAYDDYRQLLNDQSAQNHWHFLDMWNLVPASEFTNSAIHMTPSGTAVYARQVLDAILNIANKNGG